MVKFGRVGVGVLAVFGVIAAGCGSDSDSGSDASVSVPEVVIEDVAVEASSVLVDAGWVLGDSGLLEPPPIVYEEGYGPEDQYVYFTFENNSGYNLDLTLSVTNDQGQAQSQAALNKGQRVEFTTPLDDDASFGFVLTQPGESTYYSFAGDRGGAPCQDKLSEIGPGSSWRVEFVPTDGGTFGFPGTLTSADGVECTFGMLTSFQSTLVDHPVLAAVAVTLFAAATVVTGFKIAKARSLRAVAKDGEVIAAAVRARRVAPEIIALDAETIAAERAFLEELPAVEREATADWWAAQRDGMIREWGVAEGEVNEATRLEQYVMEAGDGAVMNEQIAQDFKLMVAMAMEEGEELGTMADGVGEAYVEFAHQRFPSLQRLGLVGNEFLVADQVTLYEAFLNQRRLPEIAARYAEADGALFTRVMESGVGDQITITSLVDPTFNVTRWEELYLAGRELIEEGAVVGG